MSGPEYILGGERVPVTWRTGRHAGRTVYAQAGPEPSDADLLIGVMDTPELAAEASEGRNGRAEVDELRAKVADYENGISWNTSCTSCARVLDSSYRDHARAEKAELVVAAIRGYATDLGTPMDVRITLKRMLADAGVEVAP
jgi:hypothetical protein